MHMNGGTLDTREWWIGKDDTGLEPNTPGVLEISGGVLTNTGHLIISSGNSGTVNQTGGSLTTETLVLDWLTTSEPDYAYYNLYGGTLDIGAGSLHLRPHGFIDIEEGVMTILGDIDGAIAGYVASGQLTGYGGTAVVSHDYNITNSGKTTVYVSCSEIPVGDFNQDCIVDEVDMEIMASEWLKHGKTGERDYMPRGFQAGTVADLEIPLATTAPTIDGVLTTNEWDNAMAFEVACPDILTVPKEGNIWVGSAPASHADFSLTWYFKWDNANLYIAASVTDSTPAYLAGSPGAYNSQDLIQLEFDLTKTEPAINLDGTTAIYDIVGQTSDGIGGDIYRHQNQSGNFSEAEKAAIAVAGTELSDGYVVEVALPWSVIDHTGLGYTPTVNDTHGIGLLQLDFNGDTTLTTALSAFSDMWTTASWKTVTLVNTSTQHSGWSWNTGSTVYYPLTSVADLYQQAAPDDVVNFLDFAVLAEHWLEDNLL